MRRSSLGSHLLLILLFTVFLLFFLQTFLLSPPGGPLSPADNPEMPDRGYFMGLLPVPGENQSFEEAYLEASQYADFSPVWGSPTPFYELADDLRGWWGQIFVEDYIRGNGMFPVIHVSFMGPGMSLASPPGMESATLDNPDWRNAYLQAVLEVVEVSRPLYLSIGNEVNRWYEAYGMDENNPNGFQHYVSLYGEVYDAVKSLSPSTRVFCTFAREITGANRVADMSVLDLFDAEKLDLVALTSYPYAVQGINHPSDIPDNYYSEVLAYTSEKPLALIEVGWPSLEEFGGEAGQAEFLTQLTGRLTKNQGVELALLGYAWSNDLDENDRIGLIARDGTEKQGWEIWKGLYSG